MSIRASGSEKDRIRVPGKREYRRTERLLDVFGHPPVVLFFEVAHSDYAGAGTNSKLRFVRRPADVCGRAVDAEENEGWFPAGWGGLPNEGIAVWNVAINSRVICGNLSSREGLHTLRTGNNPPALRGNIHTRHSLIMPDEFLLELETAIFMGVQFDLGIAGHGEEGPVRAEGVVCDGLMEEEMYFGGCHDECFFDSG